MSQPSFAFSLILPAYNPPADWVDTVAIRVADLEALRGPIEVILVNDGSVDSKMDAQMEALAGRLPQLQVVSYAQNKGKGYALQQGIKKASAPLVLYTDIDFPYTEQSLLAVLDFLESGTCDVAVGVKDATYYAQVPAGRRAISKGLRALSKTFLHLSITDTQCGLKGMNRRALPLFLESKTNRYLFDLESLRRCERAGLRLQPVPVTLRAGVVFPPVRTALLLREIGNFVRILSSK